MLIAPIALPLVLASLCGLGGSGFDPLASASRSDAVLREFVQKHDSGWNGAFAVVGILAFQHHAGWRGRLPRAWGAVNESDRAISTTLAQVRDVQQAVTKSGLFAVRHCGVHKVCSHRRGLHVRHRRLAPEQAAVGFKFHMEFLVTTLVSAVLAKFNASHLQHTTRALLVFTVTLLLLPRVWTIFLEFGVRAVSQLFWMTWGSIVRSVERELHIACVFTELALRTFVEHAVSMAIPSYMHEGHLPALSLPTPGAINYTSVSHPEPYPTLLVSYNTAGVTYYCGGPFAVERQDGWMWVLLKCEQTGWVGYLWRHQRPFSRRIAISSDGRGFQLTSIEWSACREREKQ